MRTVKPLERAAGQSVRLIAVGDVCIDRDVPESAFGPGLPVIRDKDILFGNCEAVYADNVARAPSASIAVLCPARNASGLGYAGFDVMSVANNHTVDGGHDGLLQTINALNEKGVQTCGAGAGWKSAHAPAIVSRDGIDIAFLAYSCIFPAGYEARDELPGIAAIRTHTMYAPSELDSYQSGGTPERITIVDPRDLRWLAEEISNARDVAHAVVVSMHAGEGTRPAVVTEYERQVAHTAIDAGASAYLGHHHHMLRGVEFYKDRPIYFGLGHYVFDVPDLYSQVPSSVIARMSEHAGEYAYGYREGYPLLPMHPDARMTVAAVVELTRQGVGRAGVVPFVINPAGQPVPVDVRSGEGTVVAAYLRDVTLEADLETEWVESEMVVGGFPVLEARPQGHVNRVVTRRSPGEHEPVTEG